MRSPVRAAAFQSILRTSSPGTYGRIIASSVPVPRRFDRKPSAKPSTRRPIETSSGRSPRVARGRRAAVGRARSAPAFLTRLTLRWRARGRAAGCTMRDLVEDRVGVTSSASACDRSRRCRSVACECLKIVDHRVFASADERQRPRSLHEADRAAGSPCTRCTVEIGSPALRLSRGGGDVDRVAHERGSRIFDTARWSAARSSSERTSFNSGWSTS